MNPKQRRFVAEYLKDQNATQAAIRAGYSKRNAGKIGPELLGKTRHVVEKRIAKIERKCEVTAERVLAELGRLAFSDIGCLYNSDGTLKSVHEWPEDARRAVAGIDSEELFAGAGQDRQHIGDLRKVKLWPKNHALEVLAKHFKLLTEKVEHSLTLGKLLDGTWDKSSG